MSNETSNPVASTAVNTLSDGVLDNPALLEKLTTGKPRPVIILLSNYSGFFLDISKKTQAQKNSKLKQNPEKTQAKSRKYSKTGNSS